MYRGGGIFSVTSKILVNDFLSKLANLLASETELTG